MVVDLADVDRMLAEIDENLIRNDLNDLERAEHTSERKRLYLVKHPETENVNVRGGPAGARKRWRILPPSRMAFAQLAAARAILELGAKLREHEDLAGRVAALEERLKETRPRRRGRDDDGGADAARGAAGGHPGVVRDVQGTAGARLGRGAGAVDLPRMSGGHRAACVHDRHRPSEGPGRGRGMNGLGRCVDASEAIRRDIELRPYRRFADDHGVLLADLLAEIEDKRDLVARLETEGLPGEQVMAHCAEA